MATRAPLCAPLALSVYEPTAGSVRARRARVGRACLLLVAAAALAASWPSAADASAGTDAAAIAGSLRHEVRAHRLPPPDAARDRETLRAALGVLDRLGRQGEAARAQNLADAVHEVAKVAQRGRLTRLRQLAVFRQLDANRRWWASRSAPGYRARVQLPGDPLVYAYYPGHGLVLHPLFNFVQANRLWFARDIAGMQRQIDALAPLAVRQPGGWLAWEYDFDYGSGQAPWRSAMAQGVALQVLARAWRATGDPVDLALAHAVLPGLTRSDGDGGLRVRSERAWWPLYGFDPGMRVLNADMQVVISLLSYAQLTGDSRARGWGLTGARAAARILPRYDTGAWSLYEGHAEADLGYHDFMTHQLGQLATITGLPPFAREHRRFAHYRVTPPRVRAPQRPVQVLYPAPRDGFRDVAYASGVLDKRASLTLRVADARGRAVLEQPVGEQGRGPVRVAWDGTVGSHPAPPGRYTLQVVAVDIVGNRSAPQRLASVQVRRDTTPPRILSLWLGRGATHRIRLHWSVRDAASPRVTLWTTLGRRTVILPGRGQRGSVLLSLRAPAHPFAVRVRVIDTSGNGVIAVRRAG